MKIQDKATNVLQRAAHLLRAQRTSRDPVTEPVWFRAVAAHPPTQNFAHKPHKLAEFQALASIEAVEPQERVPETGYYVTRAKRRSANTAPLFKARDIVYEEDGIRQYFFEQHPWELARPKLLVETDGKDAARADWSRLDQAGARRLDGESVVQRTLWLQQHEPKYAAARANNGGDWAEAYDQARLEFYRLRIREDTQTRVAMEEAAMYGAVFGKSNIERGVEKEQEYIEKWKTEALHETRAKQAKFASPSDPDEAPEASASASV